MANAYIEELQKSPTLATKVRAANLEIEKMVDKGSLIYQTCGFLALPRQENLIPTGEYLTLMIHPHGYHNDDRNPKYEQKRDSLIRYGNTSFLIGFTHDYLEEQLDWLNGLNPQSPVGIYVTEGAGSTPLFPEPIKFIASIKETFSPKRISLCGAELAVRDGVFQQWWCVGGTYRMISEDFEVIVDQDHSWKGK